MNTEQAIDILRQLRPSLAARFGVDARQEVLDMTTAKADLKELLDQQPEDSTPDELVRELAFHVMVQRGLSDSDVGRTISNEDMGRRIRSRCK